jgi:hypothetical protein
MRTSGAKAQAEDTRFNASLKRRSSTLVLSSLFHAGSLRAFHSGSLSAFHAGSAFRAGSLIAFHMSSVIEKEGA